MYILVRHDSTSRRKYVANPGSEHSYTASLKNARVFPTYESANGDRCVESEHVACLGDFTKKQGMNYE